MGIPKSVIKTSRPYVDIVYIRPRDVGYGASCISLYRIQTLEPCGVLKVSNP